MSTKKDRDARGNFVKGNKAAEGVNKRKPGQELVPHPEYPHLDTRGMPLPGHTLNPFGSGARGQKLPARDIAALNSGMGELRMELLKACKPDDIKAVYGKLFDLTQQATDTKLQLEAIKLFLERFFGKPIAEMHVNQKTTTTKINVDLTALSEDELNQYLQLQQKVQTQQATDEITIQEGEG